MLKASDSLGLLLARDDKRPALEEVRGGAAAQGEKPKGVDPSGYLDPSGNLDDLAAQRWGVIAPAGPRGDELVARIRPLIERRAEEQGAEVNVMRVPNDPRCKTVLGAAEWSKEFYDGQTGSQADVPLYQLILGDFDEVPLAIQQYQSARHGRVGRLHFDRAEGYEAYVEKLLGWERAEARKKPARLVVHTAHDNSGALRVGYAGLIGPLLELLQEERDKGRLRADDIVEGGGDPLMPDPDGFLADAASPDPGVLFSLSHGLGGPADGWRREEDRRARQGAMHFGPRDPVTGDDLATRTFMPGGVWFMFACYGAGTPDVSAYKHWLDKLAAAGQLKAAGDVLSGLKGPKPFVAALPQRVLANPKGPLAFYGHVDLAWTYSFQDGAKPSRKRPGQFYNVLDPLLRTPARVGVVPAVFGRTLGGTDSELVGLYDDDEREKKALDPAEGVRRAQLWMERQDLAGYVLLGDPAARLPIAPPEKKPAAGLFGARPAAPSVSSAPAASGAAVDGDKLEVAICKAVIDDDDPKKLAAKLGLPLEDFQRRVKAYRDAGRAALGLKPAG